MFTNRGNISLTMSVWLASDDYDLVFDENTYSVTTLLQPPRSVILSRKLRAQNIKGETDLTDIVPSRLGSAVHTAVEVAWLDSRNKALMNLGISPDVMNRIRLNPDRPDNTIHEEPPIDIYMEQRASMAIGGARLSGKFDVVEAGRVQDVKTTMVYSWIKGTNNDRYRYQGSMYRLLNQDIIFDDVMDVLYLFKDWSKWKAKEKDYPSFPIMTKTLPLLSIKDTETFVINQINLLESLKNVPQEELPQCTPEELWQDPAKYAYYRKTTNKNATKLFDTMAEAQAMYTSHGGTGGKIDYRPAEPTFCKYCDALSACTQAENFIAEGLLKL